MDFEGAQSAQVSAILGKGARFEGRLVFEGTVRIDGHFKGDIFSRDTLIIGPDAVVQAQVDADTVIVAGRLEGQVRAVNRIEIKASGYVRGNVFSPVLKIDEGGMFDGRTQMVPVEKTEPSPL